MSTLPLILALLVAVAALAVPFVERSVGRSVGHLVVGAAWLGVLGGLALMGAGLLQTPVAAFSIVGLAAFVGVPAFYGKTLGADKRTDVGGVFWIAAALSLAMVAVGWAFTGLKLGASAMDWTVFTAQWSAVMAAVSAAVCAAAIGVRSIVRDDKQTLELPAFSVALSLAVAAILGGVVLIGNLRAGIPGQGYSLVLSSDLGHVFWTVAGSAIGEKVKLQATAGVSWANGALGGLAALVVLLGLASVFRTKVKLTDKQLAGGAIVLGLGIWGTLASLLQSAGSAVLPSAKGYLTFSSHLYRAKGLQESIANRAAFVTDGPVNVQWVDLLPEMVGLGVAGAVCVIAGLRAWLLGANNSEGMKSAMYSRELSLQAVGFGWLAWIVAQFMRWNLYGTIGQAGAGEWVSLGIMLSVSAMLVFGWRWNGNRADRVLNAVAPGVIAALLILGVAVSYVFGTSFGQ